MQETLRYNADRDAWIITGENIDEGYRLVVPRDFVEAELGGAASTADCETWIFEHLYQILQAYTARTDGGWVKEPWSRVFVEVID